MFLSVVSNKSNPAPSAAASKSPFFSVSQPCWAVVRTAWPSRWGRIGTGVAWSKRTSILWGVGGCSIKAAGSKLDNGLDLFAVETVKPLHDVVDVGPGLQILEDGGYRHACALQNPRAAHLAGDALHSGTL